jgi:hypothetical protein
VAYTKPDKDKLAHEVPAHELPDDMLAMERHDLHPLRQR